MLDGLTLDQMRVFVTVAETGTFRAAAARLSRVQSAVSHAIGNLETQLEVELFDRSGHRPQLTPAGGVLLADIRGLLLKVDAVRARARGLGEGVELEIVVALDPQFPHPMVGQALSALCQKPQCSRGLSARNGPFGQWRPSAGRSGAGVADERGASPLHE